MTTRPLVLLDVDGVLAPYSVPAGAPEGYTEVRFDRGADPVLLAERHRAALARLAERADLVWCTGWMHDANRYVARWLRMAPLVVIEFDLLHADRDYPGCWKAQRVESWLAEQNPEHRPWVWVDDEVNAADEERFLDHPAPHLLLRTHPDLGLTDLDCARVEEWLDAR